MQISLLLWVSCYSFRTPRAAPPVSAAHPSLQGSLASGNRCLARIHHPRHLLHRDPILPAIHLGEQRGHTLEIGEPSLERFNLGHFVLHHDEFFILLSDHRLRRGELLRLIVDHFLLHRQLTMLLLQLIQKQWLQKLVLDSLWGSIL